MKVNLTTAKGVLKALGTAIVAAIPNTDYVPAIAGDNYLKLDATTGVTSGGDVMLTSSDTNSYLEQTNSEIHLYSKQGANIGFLRIINGASVLSGTDRSTLSSGSSSVYADSGTGFVAIAEDGTQYIALAAAGCVVSAPFFRCTGDLQAADGNAGISVTITTAKLTAGGTDGSMTFTNGLLTAQTAAT